MTSELFSPIAKSQSICLGGLKRTDVSTDSEKDDINTIDIQQSDELIIPMVNVLTRRSLFETDIDPDAMKIEIYADEKFQGSFIFSSEDLRMLVNKIHHSFQNSSE